MTEQHIRTQVGPPEWHPALDAAIRDRAVLAAALHIDPELVHHLQLLNLFLHGLEDVINDGDVVFYPVFYDHVVARLLPSDRELIEAQARIAAVQREMEVSMPLIMRVPAELLNQGQPPTVVSLEPCPECVQGKCPNCAGQVPNPLNPDDSDDMLPCPCTHQQQPGQGFLVVPPGVDGASLRMMEPDLHITCHLDTLGHHGVHVRRDECVAPRQAMRNPPGPSGIDYGGRPPGVRGESADGPTR